VRESAQAQQLRAGRELQRLGDLLLGCGHDVALEDGGTCFQAELRELGGERGDAAPARGQAGVADEGAAAAAADEHAAIGEPSQGLADRRAADAVALAKLALGRDLLAGLPFAGVDPPLQVALHLQVEWRARAGVERRDGGDGGHSQASSPRRA
jgi:hypothetical protein